jgi:long-subunit fatty acid transport protein
MKAAGSKDRATVLQFVCGMSEAEFTRFQMQVAFTGRQATALHGATSAADTKAFVKANPGAVGFLHASEVGLDVKTVLTLD